MKGNRCYRWLRLPSKIQVSSCVIINDAGVLFENNVCYDRFQYDQTKQSELLRRKEKIQCLQRTNLMFLTIVEKYLPSEDVCRTDVVDTLHN